MKACIYTRVSSDKQTAANQLEQLVRFCQAKGWEIAEVYNATESSGSVHWKRTKTDLLLAASKHLWDVLVFWSLDRLSRQGALDCLTTLQALTAYGISYRSYTEPYIDSTSPFGDVVVAFAATIAKMERERLIERTRAGIERARRQGKKLGKPRVIVDAERMLHLAREGRSLQQIGAKMGVSSATVMRRIREQKEREKCQGT